MKRNHESDVGSNPEGSTGVSESDSDHQDKRPRNNFIGYGTDSDKASMISSVVATPAQISIIHQLTTNF